MVCIATHSLQEVSGTYKTLATRCGYLQSRRHSNWALPSSEGKTLNPKPRGILAIGVGMVKSFYSLTHPLGS